MKPLLWIGFLLPLVAGAAPGGFASPGTPQGRGAANQFANQFCVPDCPHAYCLPATPTTLAPAELIAGLEEERVARDLYLTAFARWQLPVFAHVADAEGRHEIAFLRLAASIDLTTPPAATGVYTTAEMQSFYDRLLPLVNESAIAALRAGALVEETDIADLARLIATVQDDRTRDVLTRLRLASCRHLNAFVRNLERRGEVYQPQVLTPAEYADVIARP